MKRKYCSVFVLLCLMFVSCEQPLINSTDENTEKTVAYDTLSDLLFGEWTANILHLEESSNRLFVKLTITPDIFVRNEDSIPYQWYYIHILALTRDTIIPPGIYTTNTNSDLYIYKEYCQVIGAEADKCYRPQDYVNSFIVKDAKIIIAKDDEDEYYLKTFIQLTTGENHYICCKKIYRNVVIDSEVTRSNPYYGYSTRYKN